MCAGVLSIKNIPMKKSQKPAAKAGKSVTKTKLSNGQAIGQVLDRLKITPEGMSDLLKRGELTAEAQQGKKFRAWLESAPVDKEDPTYASMDCEIYLHTTDWIRIANVARHRKLSIDLTVRDLVLEGLDDCEENNNDVAG